MNGMLIPLLTFGYLLGLVILYRTKHYMLRYVWGAAGFAGLLVLAGRSWGWFDPIGAVEASILASIASVLQVDLQAFEPSSLLVPTPEGWKGPGPSGRPPLVAPG